mgnify:CR=1 FL=1|nr:MAG TPA: hypothetical protein [Caudoviricetes sp.]
MSVGAKGGPLLIESILGIITDTHTTQYTTQELKSNICK